MTGGSRLLFVYGTLRHGSGHPMAAELRRQARRIGEATVQGLLYDTGAYPAAVPSNSPNARICGELYELNAPDDAWPWLDEYEGCLPGRQTDSLFIRRLVAVRQDGAADAQAWIYWYDKPVDGFDLIEGGRYA